MIRQPSAHEQRASQAPGHQQPTQQLPAIQTLHSELPRCGQLAHQDRAPGQVPTQPRQAATIPVSPHVPPQPWSFLTFAAVHDASLPSNHIIDGTNCNHGPSAVFGARVRVAYSLAEVQSKTADGIGLTVALTQFDERARNEVEQWARFTKTLTVKRTENMCISCAVKLAHITSALLVIG